MNLLRTVNCFRWLLPVQSTSETQPVDAGLGRLMKYLISREFNTWLEIEDNLDLWETGKLTASEKRILITQFVGAAWDKLFSSEQYKPFSFFQKTGCLLTLDGSEDDKVNIEGCPDYKLPQAPIVDDDDDNSGVSEMKDTEPAILEVTEVSQAEKEPEPFSGVIDDEEIETEEE